MPNDITVVGEPTQVEISGKRFYRVAFSDGSNRHLRSVTTITKGAKLPSYLDVWEKEQIEALGVKGFQDALNQKAEDGTAVHKLIEEHYKGNEFDIQDEDVAKLYQSYLNWEEKNKDKLEIVWTEKTLYSLQYGYAGRSDAKILLDGQRLIIDFKSAKRVYGEHKEQGSAYFMAASEMGEKLDGILILALGAENKQGYTESFVTNAYDIHQYFHSFNLKNNLISFHNPVHA